MNANFDISNEMPSSQPNGYSSSTESFIHDFLFDGSIEEQQKSLEMIESEISSNLRPKEIEIIIKILEKRGPDDFTVQIAEKINYIYPLEAFCKFWEELLNESFRTKTPNAKLLTAAYFFDHYPNAELEDKPTLISILIERINKTVVQCDFHCIKIPVIKLLKSIAQFAPLSHLLSPGLLDSILVLFMTNEETHELSVLFLDKFFDRDDIPQILPDIVMNLILLLANFSPPSKSLWRFMCKLFCKYGEEIEQLCDFNVVESSGMLPLFTRNLIWDYRIIYQHPPESNHEPIFWMMWRNILERYYFASQQSNSDEPAPVIKCFQQIMNEVRLSIYFALKSATIDGKFIDETPMQVWTLLYNIDQKALISFLDMQYESDELNFAKSILQMIKGTNQY